MSGPTQFLIEHGGPVLFGVVLLEQAGLPLPALPWLVAAGALAASGKVNPFLAVGVTLLACLVADSGWFYVGRRSGKRGLGLLCRMSLEPNRCVSRSEGFLARHAEQGLVAAKFLPWLGMVVSPLAGSLGMSYRRFLLFDAIGSLLYASYGILLGFIFGEQLQQLLTLLGRLGLGVFALALAVVLGYVGFKIFKWRRASRPTQIVRQASRLSAGRLALGATLARGTPSLAGGTTAPLPEEIGTGDESGLSEMMGLVDTTTGPRAVLGSQQLPTRLDARVGSTAIQRSDALRAEDGSRSVGLGAPAEAVS